MFPALRLEGTRALRSKQRNVGLAGTPFRDAANSADCNAGYSAGQARCGWGGEEEFVVFSAVEGLGEGCGGMDGKESGIDLGGYAGLLAEVGEIGRETVAEIDGGGGEVVALEPEALGDAGLGEEVRGQQGFELLWDSEWVGWLA